MATNWNEIEPVILNEIWEDLSKVLRTHFEQDIKIEGILMLVGMREMGFGFREFSKQEKTDLIHVGTCTILEPSGYYEFEKRDAEGWPHWNLTKPIPNLDVTAQGNFLRYYILRYFAPIYEEVGLQWAKL